MNQPQQSSLLRLLERAPRATVGLAFFLTIIFGLWHDIDQRLQNQLDDFYIKNLLAIEWPNYQPYLRQHGHYALADQLEQAYNQHDLVTVARQMEADTPFSREMAESSYLDDETRAKWRPLRISFDDDHRRLSAFALGLGTITLRPITFLTYQLVPQSLLSLLANLLLLLIAGSLLELEMGSGVVMAAYFGGGIAGGLVFWLMNLGNVLPLATTSVGTAAVIGVFTLQFRGRTLAIKGGREQVAHLAWLVTALWLAEVGYAFGVMHQPVGIILPCLAGFVAGTGIWLIYRRWEQQAAQVDVAEQEPEADDVYRERLDKAMKALNRLNLDEALTILREMAETYPQNVRVLTQLYHLEKLRADQPEFETVARRLFSASTSEEAAQASLQIYKEYQHISQHFEALDVDTSLKLIMRFARVGELKEADRLMRSVITQNPGQNVLMAKAALYLSQAYDKFQDKSQAAFYRDLAARGSPL